MEPKYTGGLWVFIATPLPNPSGNTGVAVMVCINNFVAKMLTIRVDNTKLIECEHYKLTLTLVRRHNHYYRVAIQNHWKLSCHKYQVTIASSVLNCFCIQFSTIVDEIRDVWSY